jgi:hypothetical protein
MLHEKLLELAKDVAVRFDQAWCIDAMQSALSHKDYMDLQQRLNALTEDIEVLEDSRHNYYADVESYSEYIFENLDVGSETPLIEQWNELLHELRNESEYVVSDKLAYVALKFSEHACEGLKDLNSAVGDVSTSQQEFPWGALAGAAFEKDVVAKFAAVYRLDVIDEDSLSKIL